MLSGKLFCLQYICGHAHRNNRKQALTESHTALIETTQHRTDTNIHTHIQTGLTSGNKVRRVR